MFDRHYHTTIHQDHSREAARILGDKFMTISEAEIESKDRVDISLKEYERLKLENAKLKYEKRSMESIIKRLGIPVDLIDRIIPSSVDFVYCDDIKDFKKHCVIRFEVCSVGLKGE